jgi:hypothetical protein
MSSTVRWIRGAACFKEISTALVTAMGFASINAEMQIWCQDIRTGA